MARMEASAKRGVKVKAEVDTDQSVFDRVISKIRNIDLKPNFGVGINPAGWAVILTAITAAAAPLMGLVTTSLLTLPGLIASVATPVGALLLGLDGLKAAASRLEQPFNSLKEAMSAAVEVQFGSVFDKIGQTFPMLQRALPAVTQGMANMANAVLDTITSSAGMAKIESTISNIAAAMSAAAPGIGSFTNGLITLAQQFSEKLPGLSEWFNTAGASFSAWIDKITADGSLSKAFDGLGKVLKTVLDVIGQLAVKGFEFMSNPENVQTFVTTLQFVGAILTGILDLSNRMWNMLTSVRQTVESITTTILGLASGFMMAGAAAWNGLVAPVANAVLGITTTLGQVPALLMSMWANLAGIASAAWNSVTQAVTQALAQTFASVVTGAGQIVAEISTWPGKFVAALGDAGSLLVAAGRAMMQGLKQGLVDGLADVLAFAGGIAAKIAAVKGPLPYDRKVLVPAGEALMDGLGTGLNNGLDPLLNNVKSFATQIMEAAQSVFKDAVNVVFNFNMGGGMPLPSIPTGSFSGAADSLTPSSMKRSLSDETKQQLDLLGIERDRLGIQVKQAELAAKQATSDAEKDRLNAEADALRIQRDQIDIQRDQLKLQESYGTNLQTTNDQWGSVVQKTAQMPLDFGKSTGEQLLSDLGIGGQGAISQAIMGGLDYGTQFVFNVSNIDEALRAKQNELNKQTLHVGGFGGFR
ncbi:phage tail protein [Mycolicibacterium murale]|nr:hypothetical protein [Mycolicibacterium murale]MCV7186405.1 hypothetical protein [Mycolicibacterium murale]